jgi:glycosyltransferase involved in cell wall biosynthesis
MQYKVDVLISLYRSGRFLSSKLANLKSLCGFDAIRFILLNCCDYDNESEIYKDFAASPNVVVIEYKQDTTLYKCWNDGILASDSRYIMNSNVDDMLHPSYVIRCADFLDSNQDYGVVSSGVYITDKPNQVYTGWSKIGKMPLYAYPLSSAGPCPMWRRSLHDEYGLFNPVCRSIGDAIMWEKWLRNGVKFGLIEEYMVLYYMWAHSLERRCDESGRKLEQLDRIDLGL